MHPPSRRRAVPLGRLLLLAAFLVLAPLATAQEAARAPRRPIRHTDYDAWRSIQSPTLSRDGKYLAYNLMPVEGDGEFVVRQLVTGVEHRLPRGRTATATAGGDGETPPTPARGPAPSLPTGRGGGRGGFAAGGASLGGAHQFTPDVKAIVFPLIPTKAEIDRARAEKKPADPMPRTVLAIMDLETGKITARIEGATSFTVGGEGAGLLLYRRPARTEATPSKPEERPTKPATPGAPTTSPATAGTPATTPTRTPTRTYGTDLVVRNLADGKERVLADVLEFSLTRDGKLLVYTVASRKEETNGVYVLTPPAGEPSALLSGKGRYQRLTWDEKQTQLVFASDRDDAAAASPKFKVYHWARTEPGRVIADASRVAPSASTPPASAPSAGGSAASAKAPATAPAPAPAAATVRDVLGPNPPGLRTGWVINDRLGYSFSSDGSRLYVNTSPAPPPETERPVPEPATPRPPAGRRGGGAPPATAPTTPPVDENKVVLDLWHWKDDYIQPMQRVRAAGEQNRSYRAVYFLKDQVFRHLADETMDVTPAPEGDWAVGVDDRKYRFLSSHYGTDIPRDYALVNVRTGERKPLLQATHWGASFSPRGRHLLAFDGKDWNVISVPDGKKTNLTAKLPVSFVREEWDTPSEAPPHGVSGWSADEKYVLLNDRYDIWKVAVDGSEAKCLTGGYGRRSQTAFRLLRLPQWEEERERGIDLAKPILLKAENERTRDEGFFRLEPGAAEPKMLVMGARRYGLPLKAKDADTLLLTVSSCSEPPDYYVATSDFRELRRVTDANPQKKDLLWGKSELVRYKNLDGVELSGVLITPEDFDPSKKYPLLVYIYERLSQGLHNFTPPSAGTSINATYYASNGYLVLMPDIVYTVGSPGQSALKCVLPAIQAVVDRGCVDEKAIGIQGHSWGGYQIAYMVTQTTRFKAAVAGAPVSNMVSAYDGIRWGTGLPRQFQYERTQSRIGGTLWQYPTRFIENSPIFMADRVKTPLMILHNDQDDAVPWYQGIEYFLALRRLGKECYLFNYNGEFHGLRRKANQRDWTMRMQQFFDHHLKGAPKPEWMEKGVPYLERDKEKEKWKEVFGAAK